MTIYTWANGMILFFGIWLAEWIWTIWTNGLVCKRFLCFVCNVWCDQLGITFGSCVLGSLTKNHLLYLCTVTEQRLKMITFPWSFVEMIKETTNNVLNELTKNISFFVFSYFCCCRAMIFCFCHCDISNLTIDHINGVLLRWVDLCQIKQLVASLNATLSTVRQFTSNSELICVRPVFSFTLQWTGKKKHTKKCNAEECDIKSR